MISIDIGSKKVCVAEGTYRGDTVSISSFGEIGYEHDVVENGKISDRAALSFLINEIIKKNRMKSKSAVLTISSSDTIIRELKLPDVKINQLKLLVSNEMSRIVRDDHGFIVDFVIAGKAEDNLVNIMASAIPKDTVEDYYNLLKELKLTPYAMSVPEDAMSKLLTKSSINGLAQEGANTIVLDIGYSKLSFYAFADGFSKFNRTDLSPMQEFVREVESISREDMTVELMSKLSFDPDFEYEAPEMHEICKFFVYRLSEEVQKYSQYLAMNSDIQSFDRVYICGGIAGVGGLDKALSDVLRMSVETIQSMGRVNLPKEFKLSNLCVAAGAMIRK